MLGLGGSSVVVPCICASPECKLTWNMLGLGAPVESGWITPQQASRRSSSGAMHPPRLCRVRRVLALLGDVSVVFVVHVPFHCGLTGISKEARMLSPLACLLVVASAC